MNVIFKDLLDLTESDYEEIERYWDRILPRISYLGTENAVQVKEALRVAFRAHKGQNRKSGEPFIIHPVEVCILLSSLKLDTETVITGLLHDTVEALFGPTVRTIVEGETKVSKLPKLAFSDYADEQAENLRQMFIAMTEDYRIIIVKLADRLHNMRTLAHMKPEKQQKISRETLDIFAPLAHRMGIWQFKSELEDTAFMYLYPQEYKSLNRMLRRQQTRLRDILEKSTEILQRTLNEDPTLKEQNMKVCVSGRNKELYSLWHKMKISGHYSLSQVADVVAVRVVLTPDADEYDEIQSERGVWLCYHILGLVQHLPGFQPVPTRVKDYISFPKPNGYQSLHTALMMNGQTVEVQIRTSAMHRVAEFGMASHWAYKGEARGLAEVYNTPWLASIKEWQADSISSRDFVECVRRELLGKRVFVFLRNGKILNLARGATVIDAAFQIHTEVGMKMHAVEINGKPVPLSYELQNGDVVNILTGEGKPSTDWMRYAKSRSTRAKLRSYFRLKQKESLLEAGNIIVRDFLQKHADLIRSDSFLEDPDVVDVQDLANLLPGKTRFRRLDDLCIEIGTRHDRDFVRTIMSKILKVPLSVLREAERKQPSEIERRCSSLREARGAAREAGDASRTEDFNDGDVKDEDEHGETANGIVVNVNGIVDGNVELADMDHLCKDCLPIWGDDIIGTRKILSNRITTVHRRRCHSAQEVLRLTSEKEKTLAGAAKSAQDLNVIAPLNGISNSTEYIPNGNTNDVRRSPINGINGVNGEVCLNPLPKRPLHTNNGVNISSPTYDDQAKADAGASPHHSRRRKDPHAHLPRPDGPPGQEIVPLAWGPAPPDESAFLAELSVYARDRKLLLADCGIVVSRESDILKTRSNTVGDVASFDFLVKVRSLTHLDELVDKLRGVKSVTMVERKFGTEIF
uniref:Putative GTP diphosphokinase RSH1, chloroplastic n=1 Tax=Corethron hystrix TaxID=216773 RepID=A0A7S1FMD9_9STRA